MRDSLRIFAVVFAVVALFATTRIDLDNIRELTNNTSYYTVQLAEATRLEKDLLRFRADAAALVRGDAGMTPERVRLSFDLLRSRVDSEVARIADPGLRNLRGFRGALQALAAQLGAVAPAARSLAAGDGEGLARIEAGLRTSDGAMSEMNRQAYAELYRTSADTAGVQRNALHSLDRMQWVLLIVGFLGFILLLWQLRKGERLYAALEAREAEIRSLAAVDALTGLRNRRSFDERMAAIDSGAWRGTIQLLLIDLDGFKPINDQHGHAAGDHALRRVGERIAAAAGSGRLVARCGGDEFAVAFDGGPAEACRLARAIIGAIECPIDFEGGNLHVSASVGMAQLDPAQPSSEAMLKQADRALYEAKSNGRGRVRCYCAGSGDSCPVVGAIAPLPQTAAG